MARASAGSVTKSGPTLRVLGNTYTTGQPQGSQTIQIPSTAQVGDYLIIAGNNGFSWVSGTPSGWVAYYSNQSIGPYTTYDQFNGTITSNYTENVIIYVKVCEAGDIGSSHIMASGGYNFQVAVYVFTNPNKTVLSPNYGGWFYSYQGNNGLTSALTGNIDSFTYPAFAKELPPGSLTFGAYASNGNFGYPNISYSGPGTNRYVQDPYWWRGTGFFYKENTNGLISNHTVTNNGKSLAYAEIYLV